MLLIVIVFGSDISSMGKQDEDTVSLDWEKCILCQETTKEQLQCPRNSRRSDIEYGTGYNSLVESIHKFNELGFMPISLDTEKLDEGVGIPATLMKRKAKWHKTCRNIFSDMKLKRAQKRQIQDDFPSSQVKSKFTRQSSGAASSMTKEVSCFFCSSASGTLHQASTFNEDVRVRECAHQLQDEVLIAKLSAGYLISQEAVYHAKCLVLLYNKAERLNQNPASSDEKVIQGIALAQLVAYL